MSSRLVAITALRFLYGVTLKRDRFIEMLPTPRKEHYLPVILSPAEVLRFLQAAPSYSHHVIFSTMYGTGMRVSEALHLRACHIDSQLVVVIEHHDPATRCCRTRQPGDGASGLLIHCSVRAAVTTSKRPSKNKDRMSPCAKRKLGGWLGHRPS